MMAFALMLALGGADGGMPRVWIFDVEDPWPAWSCTCTLVVGRNKCTCVEPPPLRPTTDGGWVFE